MSQSFGTMEVLLQSAMADFRIGKTALEARMDSEDEGLKTKEKESALAIESILTDIRKLMSAWREKGISFLLFPNSLVQTNVPVRSLDEGRISLLATYSELQKLDTSSLLTTKPSSLGDSDALCFIKESLGEIQKTILPLSVQFSLFLAESGVMPTGIGKVVSWPNFQHFLPNRGTFVDYRGKVIFRLFNNKIFVLTSIPAFERIGLEDVFHKQGYEIASYYNAIPLDKIEEALSSSASV